MFGRKMNRTRHGLPISKKQARMMLTMGEQQVWSVREKNPGGDTALCNLSLPIDQEGFIALSLFKSPCVNRITGDAFQVVFSESGEFIFRHLRLNLTVDILKDTFYRSGTDHSNLGGLDALIQQRF